MTPPDRISARDARRIALRAQGFGSARPGGRITQRHPGSVIDRLGLLQIDSVNVLSRMHYLPLFSRLGDYPRSMLDEAAWGRSRNRRLFEYWAHEASLLPLETHSLLRWRMERAYRGKGVWGRTKPFAGERRPEAEALLKRLAVDGPMAASEIDVSKGEGGWWGWSDTKSALEWLFWSGQITTKTRRPSFERVYDLTERVIPSDVLNAPTPAEQDAHRALLAIAAKALGVASVKHLRDYFRLSPEDAKPRIQELVEAGVLFPVDVEGWSQLGFLHEDACSARKVKTQALLAPFDPLIWERSRTEQLFDFRYRIEIYIPADKREHGYYVLPFLMDEALVARVDLKADRSGGVLVVQASHLEPGAPPSTPERLATELRLMALWLGLEHIRVEPKGDLAGPLKRCIEGTLTVD